MKRSLLFIALLFALTNSCVTGQSQNEPQKLNVAVLVFDGVQIIDFTGPWEIFGEVFKRGEPAFRVFTVAEKVAPVTSFAGLQILPNFALADAPRADVLLLPGGGVDDALNNPRILEWVKARTQQAQLTLSVCNGAYFLAKAGLLDGLNATTTAGNLQTLQTMAPRAKVTDEQRVVDNGRIITAGGLTAGIDGALHVVKRLFGEATARTIAGYAEYNWQAEGQFLPARLAYKNLVPVAFAALLPLKADLVSNAGDTEQWDSQWLLQAPLSPEQTLTRINEAVETTVGWRRDTAASATQAGSAWVFRDFKGVLWSGQITVQPGEKAPSDKMIRLRVFKADASKAQALNAQPAAVAARTETLTGHLMPFKCRLDDPVAHTTECALLPACRASGYGLLLADGSFVKFDAAGNEQAAAALKATTKKNDLRAQASGTRNGNTLKVETLTLP